MRPREAPPLRHVRARGRRRRGRRPVRLRRRRLGDIFEAFFGGGGSPFGGGGRARRGPARGTDLEVAVDLEFEQAVFGTQAPVVGAHRGRLRRLRGHRRRAGHPARDLRRVRRRRPGAPGPPVDPRPDGHGRRRAPAAAASARSSPSPCPDCRGEGRRIEQKTYTVDIPAGVDTGSTLRLAGRGAVGPRGGGARRPLRPRAGRGRTSASSAQGYDLVDELHIPFTQAALGAVLPFETLDGDEDLVIPRGTQTGRVFRLRGRGVPHVQGRGRGDLLVQVVVDTPDGPRRRRRRTCSASSPRSAARRSRRQDTGLPRRDPLGLQVDGRARPAELAGGPTSFVDDLDAPGARRRRPAPPRPGAAAPARRPAHRVRRARRVAAGPLRRRHARARRADRRRCPAPIPPITIAFAPVKGERPEWSCRSSPSSASTASGPSSPSGRWCGGTRSKQDAHAPSGWRGVAREAAMQSRRCWLPEVHAPCTLRRRSPRSTGRRSPTGRRRRRAWTDPGAARRARGRLVRRGAGAGLPDGAASGPRCCGPRRPRSRPVSLLAAAPSRPSESLSAALTGSPSCVPVTLRGEDTLPRLIATRTVATYRDRPQAMAEWGAQDVANETDTTAIWTSVAQLYGRRSASVCGPSAGRRACRCRRPRRPRTRSSRRRCSAPTSAASGPSRCPGSSAWPASTTCRSTSCCRGTTSPSFRGRRGRRSVDLTRPLPAPPSKITLDLTRLDELHGTAAEMLTRYLAMIQVQRQDFNGRMLTIRRDDLRAIACILDTTVDGARQAARRAGPRLHPFLIVGAAAPTPVVLASSRELRRLPARAVLPAPLRLLRLRHLDRPDHLVDRYLRGLPAPRRRAPRPTSRRSPSVFVGGGTPSLVPADAARRVLEPAADRRRRRGHRRVQPRRRHGTSCSSLPRRRGHPALVRRAVDGPARARRPRAAPTTRRTSVQAAVEAAPEPSASTVQPRPHLRAARRVARPTGSAPSTRRSRSTRTTSAPTPSPSSRARRWPPTRPATPTTTTRPTSTSSPTERLRRSRLRLVRDLELGPARATSAATTSSTGPRASTSASAAPPTSPADGRRCWNVRTPERYVAAIESGRSPEAGRRAARRRRAAPVEGLQLGLRTATGVPADAFRRRTLERARPAWSRSTTTGSSSPGRAVCWPTRSPSASDESRA